MTLTIPKRIEPRAPLPEGALAIPATIFQTFKSAEVPERIHDAAMGWVERNPGFAYRFFDDADARAFVGAHFGERALAAFDRTPPGAFRADFWRYCALFVEGGVYIDIDSICECDLAELLGAEETFVSARAGNLDWAIYNGFVCTVPGHPFLKRAIERATDLILDVREGELFDGYTLVGPGTLGAAANEVLGRRPKAPHAIGSNVVNGHAYRLLRKVARNPERSGHLLDGDRLVLWTEYPEYRDDIASTGTVHWTSTRRREGLLARALRKGRRLARRII